MSAIPTAIKPKAQVLVVEDNPVMGKILATLLSRMGLEYKTVPNGREAIKAAQSYAYDLILMDVMMPEMNGIEATEEIRASGGPNAKTPIIAVTGNADGADITSCMKAGMNGHLKKPVGQFALRQAVEGFLNLRQQAEAEDAASGDESTGKEGGGQGGKTAAVLYAETKDDEDALNWDAFREYGALLKGKLPRLLKDFLRAGPDLLGELNAAILEDDAERLTFLAHKLKSTSLVFGAEAVSDIAATLEKMGREGDLSGAQAVFYDLHVSYERTQAVLRQKLVLLRNMG